MNALRPGAIGTPEYTDGKLAALRDDVKQLHADLAKLTRDAAAENARLRAELADLTAQRDQIASGWTAQAQQLTSGAAECGRLHEQQNALIAAAQAWVDYWDAPATEPSNWGVLRDALRAAIAACTTEMKS